MKQILVRLSSAGSGRLRTSVIGSYGVAVMLPARQLQQISVGMIQPISRAQFYVSLTLSLFHLPFFYV